MIEGNAYWRKLKIGFSDLQEMDGLLTLQTQFSKYLHIRTVIMDFHMFKNRVG